MCRLAYITRQFSGLSDWLLRMEASNGGHGAGIAVGGESLKGLAVDARRTLLELATRHVGAARRKKRKAPALWHSRWASSGVKCDDLCHPFECDGGWMVHNGHWHEMHEYARKVYDGSMSDTRLFAGMVDRRGFAQEVKRLRPPGVWLHMLRTGELAVSKRGGSLYYSPDLSALGSEPATIGRWFPVVDGLYQYGEDIEYAVPTKRYSVAEMFRGLPA